MFKKILILSATAGAGHTKAGEALAKAFQASGTAEEIRHEDALHFTRWWFRFVYSWGYWFTVQHFPHLFGFLFRISNHPWKNERARYWLDRIHAGPLVRLIREYQPDWLLTTHFLPPHLISRLLSHRDYRGKLAVVVTDFDVHAYWLCHYYDHYFVALDETRKALEWMGIDSQKITVSGIPIDPVFAIRKDKDYLCRKHGVLPDLPSILVSTGASAIGPVKELVQQLLTVSCRAQIVAVCGHNQSLYRELHALSRLVAESNPIRLTVVGYTTEMDEFMSICEVIVGKPGGLTVSEALAKGLVFVAYNPIPGQEERNAAYLTKSGAGFWCHEISDIQRIVSQLLADTPSRHKMQETAYALGHPDAAANIVRKLTLLSHSG